MTPRLATALVVFLTTMFVGGAVIIACEGKRPKDTPPVEFACRDGYRVPLGDAYRDLTMSNGIACAARTDWSPDYGHVVCWTLHGCQR